ncbi:hypothetical protein [Streptomyces sp. NPDC003393]
MYLWIPGAGWTVIAVAATAIACLSLRMMFRAEALPEDVRETARRRRRAPGRWETFFALLAVSSLSIDLLSLPTDMLFFFSAFVLVGLPLGFLSVRRRMLEHWAHQLRTGGDFRAQPDYGLMPRLSVVVFGSVLVLVLAADWLQKAT